jgi:cyclase
MPDWKNYRYGVQRVSDNVYAYLLPDGSWSLNNTAFVISDDHALLIDTLVDIPMTKRMLSEMAAAEPRARRFDDVVLTHWHIDHVHGVCVEELKESRIHASRACAEYMAALPPDKWKQSIAALSGDAKRMMDELIGTRFDFSGLRYRAPTHVFEKVLDLSVGSLDVHVEELKPNHTLSDSVVFVRQDGVVHSGDLVVAGRHVGIQYPFMQNLIDDCEILIGLDADTYIPGHGPILNTEDLRDFANYLRFLMTELRLRYDKGLSSDEAASDLLNNLGPYRSLGNPQSLFFTASMVYAEFAGDCSTYLRKDYQGYLAKQWRLKHELPAKHPELFAEISAARRALH